MYSDNSLLPKEAVRLAALGTLASRPMSYAELVTEVRHFTSRIAGPSLELMGASFELLRYEGLVEGGGNGDDTPLVITDAGLGELRELLRAAVRAPFNDMNKLVMALKIRFLHLLDGDGQRDQADMMIDACRTELARLVDLKGHHQGEEGHFGDWLDHDIGLVESRLAWLEAFHQAL